MKIWKESTTHPASGDPLQSGMPSMRGHHACKRDRIDISLK